MTVFAVLKPTHKAIKAYREALDAYAGARVDHEGATETAFQRLLNDAARAHGWMLVPKLPIKRGGKSITPDGTVRDEFNLHRGYWEAKDTDDDLTAEIRKKIAKGYPLTNTIFEDTTRAVLYQNGQPAFDADLTDPQALCDLLNAFFAYLEPDYEKFEEAVDEFKDRVPELAQGLADIIKNSHDKNVKFQSAFDKFFTLCRTALNPNIRRDAVDEMLIQHLLTERLIRTIFNKDDFTRQNVIAAEVETVIGALTSQSFSRSKFLERLDRFYVAIEHAAESLEDFSEKQHFLNTVYERFFQGYSVKVADTHGIVYTPQEIVDFMCASVAEVLEKEFGKSLGDKDVHILDPCTGTGNFLVNLINRIPKRDLPRMYRQQLFANEVMLLPYYIAALNIEHAYYEKTGQYEPFEGLCFVDTLDLAEEKQNGFSFMTEENTARVVRQRAASITVIIGNPPYNVGQINANDNNRNRTYSTIDKRIKGTFARDSKATSVSKLNDPYVKFFRWAIDRLGNRDGIVCFISNNSFVEQIAFDGMRKHLFGDFTRLYHLDLEGNVRENPTLSGTQYNVFGIQVGVGITIAVRLKSQRKHRLFFHRIAKELRRNEKLNWLSNHRKVSDVKWRELTPDSNNTWIVPENGTDFAKLVPLGTKEDRAARWSIPTSIFKEYGLGVATHRDAIVYDFHRNTLANRAERFADAYNGEVDRYKRAKRVANIDDFLDYDKVVWDRDLKNDLLRGRYAEFDETKIRTCLYRPFTRKYLVFDRLLNAEVYTFPKMMPTVTAERDNRVISVSQIGYRAETFSCLAASQIVDLHLCATLDGHQCFPFYIYDEDGRNRRENITDWALNEFRKHYRITKLTKWDIFHYVYGLLHHAGYRKKYSENLKRELPRISFAPDFAAFNIAGHELLTLHLNYDGLRPAKLKWVETEDVPLSYRVEKMKLERDKKSLHVNASLTLADIPPETFEYRLGNRSALEWVIDQYQVSTDKRSGIVSDPNRADDPEYIVRLIGQVVRVSVETVNIVRALPEEFEPAAK